MEKAGQKIIIKNPIKAPLIKKAFEMFSTGNFNVFDITDITYEKGLKTKHGKKLSYSRMYEILEIRFILVKSIGVMFMLKKESMSQS